MTNTNGLINANDIYNIVSSKKAWDKSVFEVVGESYYPGGVLTKTDLTIPSSRVIHQQNDQIASGGTTAEAAIAAKTAAGDLSDRLPLAGGTVTGNIIINDANLCLLDNNMISFIGEDLDSSYQTQIYTQGLIQYKDSQLILGTQYLFDAISGGESILKVSPSAVTITPKILFSYGTSFNTNLSSSYNIKSQTYSSSIVDGRIITNDDSYFDLNTQSNQQEDHDIYIPNGKSGALIFDDNPYLMTAEQKTNFDAKKTALAADDIRTADVTLTSKTITAGTTYNVASLTIPAGKWYINGGVAAQTSTIKTSAGAVDTSSGNKQFMVNLSTTSASSSALYSHRVWWRKHTSFTSSATSYNPIFSCQKTWCVNFTSETTVYLNVLFTGTSNSKMTLYDARISAIRIST